MPYVQAASARTVRLHGATFTCLAAPSTGATETCVWRTSVAAAAPAAPHTLDREEVILVLSGQALVQLGDAEQQLGPGDVVIVPPHTRLALTSASTEPIELVAVLPVGARATMVGGEGQTFVPPCAQ